jgi:hypothetical protein
LRKTPIFSPKIGKKSPKIVITTSTQDEFVKKYPKMFPQPILSKLMHNFYRGKSSQKLGFFCNEKTTQTHPKYEKSPNLVTLASFNILTF